ncbi:hypothetical protein FRB96_004459 [Tulasnella sp. 330]|nr:hypothetical protein FRB96_004459 [Tulasnella sp. 330]
MPLISFCSTIPSLPRDYPTSSPLRALPIIPLRLPSPETFIIIRDYIYTHSKPLLVTSLLAWTKGHRNAPARLSQLSAMELMRRARIVYGVYSNACKVGLADEEFWKCLQLAWKIILMALVNARKA